MTRTVILRFSAIIAVMSCVMWSCKDMGETFANPLTATSLSVTLSPGGSATLTISGGRPPYSISRQPDAALATATLTNNPNGSASLLVQAVSANVSGTTSVKVKDSDTHGASDGPLHEESEIEIAIRVSGTVISFSGQVQPIFDNRCVNVNCHPGGGAPFPLRSPQGYTQMVNQAATTGPCRPLLRVKPGDAVNSALYRRLIGTCGDRMPFDGSGALTQAQIDLIRDWINQGALNN